MSDRPEIVAAGDSTLIVRFEERIDAAVNARAIALADAVSGAGVAGVRDVVASFRSVAVSFDPLRTDRDELREVLETLAAGVLSGALPIDRAPVRVPVQYGGAAGPDLGEVARFAGLAEDEVVALHTARIYRVFMLGFVPGFAYMGVVDDRIAAPRRTTPRTSVASGSVAIAGRQTGIYPMPTPGGWQIIGRTSVAPFDAARDPICLFKPGDSVQFVAMASQ